MEARHDTVLLAESVEGLEIRSDDVVVDATLGGAGHFKELLKRLSPEGAILGIDADEEALDRARTVVEEVPEGERPQVRLVNGNFRDLAEITEREHLTPTKVLFDLGWSGFQLARGRGFSFKNDEPLLMTYGNPEESTTAKDLVNHLSEESLADMLWSLGEERFAKSIARSIIASREETSIETTFALVEAVEAGVPAWYKHRRLHPATKTFQALRIAVNDELGAIREGVGAAMSLVPAGGRVAVITFHSIEDRIVKSMFRDAAQAGQGTLVSRKPVTPSSEECAANPRARSAKLRIFEASVSAERAPMSHKPLLMYA